MIRQVLEAIRRGRPLSYLEIAKILTSEGWYQVMSNQTDPDSKWRSVWDHEDYSNVRVFVDFLYDPRGKKRTKVTEVSIKVREDNSESEFLSGMYPGPKVTSIKGTDVTEQGVRDLVRISK